MGILCKKLSVGFLIVILGYLALLFIFEKKFFEPLDGNGFSSLFITIFICWGFSFWLGKIVSLVKISPLLGEIISGIVIRNLDLIERNITEDDKVGQFIRNLAFIFILMRTGFGLDIKTLQKYLLLSFSLGIISTICEIIAITGISYFSLNLSFSICLTFASILASVSPAVIVPIVIELQEKKIGTNQGLPTIILVNATIINIFCITFYSVCLSIFYGKGSSSIWLLFSIPTGILFGIGIGFFMAFILRNCTRIDSDIIHLQRSLLLILSSVFIFFGCKYFSMDIVGPICILVITILMSIYWNNEDEIGTEKEEKILKNIWNYILEPLIFCLIGMEVRFSNFDVELILVSLFIILFGLLFKLVSLFVISFKSHLNIKERIFLSISLIPKATVQATLAPAFSFILITKRKNQSLFTKQSADIIILNICIISILITAPIGHMLMALLNEKLLKQEKNKDEEINEEKEEEKCIDKKIFKKNGNNSNIFGNQKMFQSQVLSVIPESISDENVPFIDERVNEKTRITCTKV
ncbi:GH07323p [Strongyloides ratti]|uniref:GH07323p n=1 Tax=Strongyloides ratti TaxID=34506 RepID=A0A090LEU8_STRRB|nr:GH07323p [Strongyloides ratti]CEF68267.1 GH07323p [Strongyloides ratti]